MKAIRIMNDKSSYKKNVSNSIILTPFASNLFLLLLFSNGEHSAAVPNEAVTILIENAPLFFPDGGKLVALRKECFTLSV